MRWFKKINSWLFETIFSGCIVSMEEECVDKAIKELGIEPKFRFGEVNYYIVFNSCENKYEIKHSRILKICGAYYMYEIEAKEVLKRIKKWKKY